MSIRRCFLLLLFPVLIVLLLDRRFPLPLPDTRHDTATVVVARDGTPVRAFADAKGIWRYPVTPEEVSPLYLEALLGFEDRHFYRHWGINPLAMLRATVQAIRHRQVISGGSTITMQVARMIEPIPHSYLGKLWQMARAVQLEWHLSKDEILTLYLNYAPFGGTLQGVQAASYGYLGKPASQLSHAEAALLAVLPQSPSRLRPDRWPARAQAARDKVINRLIAQGKWPTKLADEARQENVVARQLQPPLLAPLAAERLRQAMPTARRIQTTLDPDLQARVEARVTDWTKRLPPGTSAAVIVADTPSMAIRAYVGAAQFADEESYGHIDMARAWRSPGSTLKPFLYGMALDEGLIHSESLLIDAPQSFGDYRPGNFDQRFRGPVSARDALQQSLNVPAVTLLDAIGPARFSARMAHAHVPLRLPRGSDPNLAMILGGTEARLEDLIGAYGALFRDGLAQQPSLIASSKPDERRLLSPGSAWIIRQMLLESNRPSFLNERLVHSSRTQLAWKTGTSYGFRDAWAIGVNPDVVIGIWIGRPDGTPLPGQYGAITALPLLFAINGLIPNALRNEASPKPDSVSDETICWPLGGRLQDTAPHHCRQKLEAWLLDNTSPPTLPDATKTAVTPVYYRRDRHTGRRLDDTCQQHHEEELSSYAPWPLPIHPWLSRAERQASMLPSLAADCQRAAEPRPALRIDGLLTGTVISHPSNKTRNPEVRLRVLGATGQVEWLLDGQRIARSRGENSTNIVFEHPGQQRLVAIDEEGHYAEIAVNVLIGSH